MPRIRLLVKFDGSIIDQVCPDLIVAKLGLGDMLWWEFIQLFDTIYTNHHSVFELRNDSSFIFEKYLPNETLTITGTLIADTNSTFIFDGKVSSNRRQYLPKKFLEIITNEVRNPLVGLIASTDLYLNYGKEFKLDHHKYFRLTRKYALKMSHFIERVTHVMQVDSEMEYAEYQPVIIKQLLSGFQILSERKLNLKQAKIEDKTTGNIVILGSTEQIQLLLDYLLDFCLQQGKGKRNIRFQDVSRGYFRGFQLSDTSLFVSNSDAQFISGFYFNKNPDFTVATKEIISLGFYLIHRIIQKHSGKLLITSTPENGTVFTVLFPEGRFAYLDNFAEFKKSIDIF